MSLSSEEQPPSDRLSTAAKWSGLAILVVATTLTMLIAAELAVRLRATLSYGTTATAEDLYAIDRQTGLRVARRDLRAGRIQTNSMGFRSPEILVKKPDDVVRIAFLGASTTWCAEVSSNDHTWPALVMQRLRRSNPSVKFDFVNAAVPGYTVRSIERSLESRVAPLSPDVIVIYEATNDLSGELRRLALQSGVLESEDFLRQSWLARHSLLWELAEKNIAVLLAGHAAADAENRLAFDPAAIGAVFSDDMRRLVDTAKRHAKLVAVATFATHIRPGQNEAEQRRAMESALVYMPFMTHEGLVAAYERYNDRIRAVAGEASVLLIDELETIPGTPAYFVDSVHFSDRGAEAMARRVANALEPALAHVLAVSAPR